MRRHEAEEAALVEELDRTRQELAETKAARAAESREANRRAVAARRRLDAVRHDLEEKGAAHAARAKKAEAQAQSLRERLAASQSKLHHAVSAAARAAEAEEGAQASASRADRAEARASRAVAEAKAWWRVAAARGHQTAAALGGRAAFEAGKSPPHPTLAYDALIRRFCSPPPRVPDRNVA